jgi:hypothetical protein
MCSLLLPPWRPVHPAPSPSLPPTRRLAPSSARQVSTRADSASACRCRAPSKSCRFGRQERGGGPHGRARRGRGLRGGPVPLGAAPAQLGRAVPARRGAAPPAGVRAPGPLRRDPPRSARALGAGPRRGTRALPARRLLPRRRGRAGAHGGRRPRNGPPWPPRRLLDWGRLRPGLRGRRDHPADGGGLPPAQEVRAAHHPWRHPRRRVRVHFPAEVLQARRVRGGRRPPPARRRQPALEPLPHLLRGQLQDEVPAARVPGDGGRRVPAGPHHLQHPRRGLLQDVHVLGPPPQRRPHAPRRRRAGPRHSRLLRRRLPRAPPRAEPHVRVRPPRRRRRARRGYGPHRVRGVRQGRLPRQLRGAAGDRRREAALDVLQTARRLPQKAT